MLNRAYTTFLGMGHRKLCFLNQVFGFNRSFFRSDDAHDKPKCILLARPTIRSRFSSTGAFNRFILSRAASLAGSLSGIIEFIPLSK